MLVKGAPGLVQYADHLSMHQECDDQEKTVLWVSFLYHGDPYTGEMASLYWNKSVFRVNVNEWYNFEIYIIIPLESRRLWG